MKNILYFLITIGFIYSQDIYVDGDMDYEKQYYAKFDRLFFSIFKEYNDNFDSDPQIFYLEPHSY